MSADPEGVSNPGYVVYSIYGFARTKIILARAIFDEIHGVRSNPPRSSGGALALLVCARPFPPRVAR